jgi:uncharacterized protein involved in exopolysaccharide biosynthesis
MAEGNLTGTAEASWLGPETDENELRRYLTTLRHRGWLIAATMLVAVVLAVIYVAHATPVYQAQSSLLVSPVANGTSVPSNIAGLLYQSADPTRDIQTAANVVSSMQTAQAVNSKLRLHQSASQILGDISFSAGI